MSDPNVKCKLSLSTVQPSFVLIYDDMDLYKDQTEINKILIHSLMQGHYVLQKRGNVIYVMINKKQSTILLYLLLSLLAVPLLSCGGSGYSQLRERGDTIPIKYADYITMVDFGDYLKVDTRNPWDTTRMLQTYLLVPKDEPLPKDLPKGTVVRVPLERSVVYTAVHNSLIDELGHIDAISGVCDAQYIHNQNIASRIASGSIEDCGSAMAPNLEKLIMINPQAIVLSAFENSNDHNKVAQMGIPIIDASDYMESSPLGRAEWIKFYGRLYGEGAQADSLFEQTVREYENIKSIASAVSERPHVIMDLIYSGVWSVPGASSTTGIYIIDAGGSNPFESYLKSGSVQLSPEEVLYKASDADKWIIRYAQDKDLTLRQMASDNPIYAKFAPFKTGEVYGTNTQFSDFFDQVPFHPQWLLENYVAVIHPELGIQPSRQYFQKIEP